MSNIIAGERMLKDPEVTIDYAVKESGGSQVQLASRLEITRANITIWKRLGSHLPPVWAYRWAWYYGLPGYPSVQELMRFWRERNPEN